VAKLPIIKASIHEVQLKTIADPVKFRPFTVKEEKILLTAAHGIRDTDKMNPKQKKAMTDAMVQICNNCTFGEIDVLALPIFDLNMLFTRLKQYSSGNGQKIKVPCQYDECGKETVLEVDYDKFIYEDNPDHVKAIPLVDDISIAMKYPSFQIAAKYDPNSEDPTTMYNLTVECLDMVIVGEEATPASHYTRAELDEFLDSLTTVMRTKLTNFFSTMPKTVYEINYKCPHCGKPNTFRVDSIEDFFV
jgi:hypothetical protein